LEIICVDTDILIEYNRKKTKSESVLYRLTGGFDIAVTTITVYEIFRGDNQDEDRFWKGYFASIKVLPFSIETAETAAGIYRSLKSNLIDMPELLIGAIAFHENIPLATLNKKHFQRIPGLKLLDF